MQAPIGPASSCELVSAVSEIGGLGTLAASWTDLGELRDQIERVRAATSKPFCVNLVLAFDQRERLELCLQQRVPVVSFSWGVEPALIGKARGMGAPVLVQIGNLQSAKRAADAGATALIAQGTEAGGHVEASTAVLTLVRELRAQVGLPIVAAGGIGDGNDARRAIDAGASAVACGTAFLAALEADVHPDYRAQILAADASDTELTEVFDVGWPRAPHRVLRNPTVSEWEAAGRPPPGERPGEGEVVGGRAGRPIVRYSDAQPTRETTGDVHAMALYAGTSVGRVRRVGRAREIAASIAGAIR